MRVASMDDEEDIYTEEEHSMPSELMEKVRLAFLLLEESRVLDEGENNIVLSVNRADYEEFCKYFNATRPFSRGRKKGKVPVGNRARGYITMEKVEDKSYVLRYWDRNDGDYGRTLTYKADTPHLVDINLRDYYLFELPIINRLR